MPARPKDELIARMAAQAGKVPLTPSTPEQDARCAGKASFPWTYRKPEGAWIVKVSWGGDNWGIGRFSDPVSATRFADMAIRRFWKYRKNSTPLTDAHLTHGITNAIADEAANISASVYLDAIESRLITLGVITTEQAKPTT